MAKVIGSQEHAIDKARTIFHDYDRAGTYYSAWCVCGKKLADRLPHYRKNPSDHPGCTDTVEDSLENHVRKVS